jgi:hypothetical protein
MVERVAGGYLVTGSSVDVFRASNFFDLLKAYDGTFASLEPKPLNDAQTGLRPMIAARDAEQAPDHAVSGSEAETPNAPYSKAWLTIKEMQEAIIGQYQLGSSFGIVTERFTKAIAGRIADASFAKARELKL